MKKFLEKHIMAIPTILVVIIATVFIACGESPYEKRLSNSLNDVKKPCVVTAVQKRDKDAGFHGGYGSIILKGSDGVYTTFDGNSYEGGPLVASYNKGDTIK